MKREAKMLHQKALDSLILAVEHFNCPNDRGRITAVLILLDHAFEMLLKAAILHKGGDIRYGDSKQTIGFDACVRKSLSDSTIHFLSEEEALTLQTINGLRDAAQHHLIDISEEQLYIHAQSGITLFKDILKKVFQDDLISHVPERVLPICVKPPVDIITLFDSEVKSIKKLLQPKKRKRTEALARLRPLAILNATIEGQKTQPSDKQLSELADALSKNKDWTGVFSSVAAIELTANGSGQSIDLRITKKEGMPVQIVPEGTPGASVIALKRVNELDYYNLGLDKLSQHLKLNRHEALAAVMYLKLQHDSDCFKEIVIGSQCHKRYSQQAISKVKEALRTTPIGSMTSWYQQYRSQHKSAKQPVGVTR